MVIIGEAVLFVNRGFARPKKSRPSVMSGAGERQNKNLTDESGCKPLIRQDAYFFGVIASLPHIYLFFGVDLAFHKIWPFLMLRK